MLSGDAISSISPAVPDSHKVRESFAEEGSAAFVSSLIPKTSAWQNPRAALDVNDDGLITPIDVLLIINRINGQGAGPLPSQNSSLSFLDVNGDGNATAIDALLGINHLNNRPIVPTAGTPGQKVTFQGAFDTSQAGTVVFTNGEGYRIEMPALELANYEATVQAPIYIDPQTATIEAGSVNVSVVQGSREIAVANNFQIGELPQVAGPPGTLALEYLRGTKGWIHAAIIDLQQIAAATGAVQAAPLLAELNQIQDTTYEMESLLAPLFLGEVERVNLGTMRLDSGTEIPVSVDTGILSLYDRVLASYLIDESAASGQLTFSKKDAIAKDDLLDSITSKFIDVLGVETPAQIREVMGRFRNGALAVTGIATIAATGIVGAPALAVGAVAGAGVLVGTTLLETSIIGSLEGGVAKVTRGQAEPADFRSTIGGIVDGAVDTATTLLSNLSGKLVAGGQEQLGRALGTLIDTSANIIGAVSPGEPSGVAGQIEDNYTAIQNNVQPPPAGISYQPSGDVLTSESGDSANVDVYLNRPPTGNVNIQWGASHPELVDLEGASMQYQPQSWALPHTLYIEGTDDGIANGNIDYAITGTITSSDPRYHGLVTPAIQGTSQDTGGGGQGAPLDLAILSIDGPRMLSRGATATYSINMANLGTSIANNITANFSLLSNAYLGASLEQVTSLSGTCDPIYLYSEVTCTFAELEPGESLNVTLHVRTSPNASVLTGSFEVYAGFDQLFLDDDNDDNNRMTLLVSVAP